MKFSDAELREAAVQAEKYLLAQLPPEESCRHEFSPEFEQKMALLLDEMKHNKVKPCRARMGWQFYTRNGVAAVLLCFLLAFVTMPEAVIANCQKVLETVETIFTEYTEYRYQSNATGETEFHPLKLTYLPEGMEEVKREEGANSIDLLFLDETQENYLSIHQSIISENDNLVISIDSENVENSIITVHDEKIKVSLKENDISFIWLHGLYQISGQTNLSKDELKRILEHIEFPEE